MYTFTLWDRYGYGSEATLENIYDAEIRKELNREHTLTFSIALQDPAYPYLTYRKIIRAHHPDVQSAETTVFSDGTGKTLLVNAINELVPGVFVWVRQTVGFTASVTSTDPNAIALKAPAVNAGLNQVIEHTSTTFTNGQYVKIYNPQSIRVPEQRDGDNEIITDQWQPSAEVVKISNVTSTQFTANLGNDYYVGSWIEGPTQAYVARVLNVIDNFDGTLTITLSRKDFGGGLQVQLVNFETYRITEIVESSSGVPSAQVTCHHITHDINNSLYLVHARPDISASSRSLNLSLGSQSNIPTLVDTLFHRDKDMSGDPLTTDSFIPGNFVRRYHTSGKIQRDGTTTVTGIGTNWKNISPGSQLYIEQESTVYTVKQSNATPGGNQILVLDQAPSNSLSYWPYLLIEHFHSNTVNQYGTCTASNGSKTITSIAGLTVDDGSIRKGCRLHLSEDTKVYIVDYIHTSGDVILTEGVERPSGTNIGCEFSLFSRPYTMGSTRTRLGLLNEVVEQFSTDSERYHYHINEDRSIDIVLKPNPDDRDPTSNLVLQRGVNLDHLERRFDVENFGNVVIPFGASSGWQNAESGVRGTVQGDITGTSTSGSVQRTTGSATSGSATTLVDTSKNFVTAGVIVGDEYRITSQANNWARVTSITTTTNTNDTLNSTAGFTGSIVVGSGDTYEVYDELNTLTDTAKDFVNLGVIPGMTLSQGSEIGTITTITATVLKTTGSRSAFVASSAYTIDIGNATNQVKLVKGDTKKFRAGDPITIFHKKYDFNINETTQVTVTRGLTGIATGGSGTTLIDTTKTFDNSQVSVEGPIIPGMMVTKTNRTSIVQGYITSITGSTIVMTTLPSSEVFGSGDTYRLTLTSQWNYYYDQSAASGSRFVSTSTGAFTQDTPNDAALLPTYTNALDAEDGCYFGSNHKFEFITIDIGTQGTSTAAWVGVWEYYNGSGWTALTFDYQEVVDFTESVGLYTNSFTAPSDWSTIDIGTLDNNDNDGAGLGRVAYWVRFRITTGITEPQYTQHPLANYIINREWEENRFHGGMVFIETGEGRGQMRPVHSNTVDTLNISKRWDPLPLTDQNLTASATVAQKVVNTFVKGFGYRQFSTAESNLGTLGISGVVYATDMPVLNYAYRNGILAVKEGIGVGQFYKIQYSVIETPSGTDPNDGAFLIEGTFNPIPKESVIEVSALPQKVEEFRSGTVFSAGPPPYVEVSLTLGHNFTSVGTDTGIWNNGTLFITSGSRKGSSFTITRSENRAPDTQGNKVVQFQVASWNGSTPTDGDGILLVQETDLHLGFADTIPFKPTNQDEIVLLLKETGGPLTIGKCVEQRSTVVVATQTDIDIQVGDGQKFDSGQLIFVGARTLVTDTRFNINRGDQVTGTEYTIDYVIKSKHTGTGSTIQVIDSTKDFVTLGVRAGMKVYHPVARESGTIATVTSTTLTLSPGFTTAIQTNDPYIIDVLFIKEPINPVPQPGDHIETISLSDPLSVHKYQPVERVEQLGDINVPGILFHKGLAKLNDIKEQVPRYQVGFTHRRLLDRSRFEVMDYELGDSVKVVDRPITDGNGVNLQIVRESFDPLRPADRTRTLFLERPPLRFVEDTLTRLHVQQAQQNHTLQKVLRTSAIPGCVWWDDQNKQCRRTVQPNTFCESSDSNEDGKMTKEFQQITRNECRAYTPHHMGGHETARINGFQAQITGINNDDWNTIQRFPISSTFTLSEFSYCFTLDVTDEAAPTSQIEVGQVECRVQVDVVGGIVPYQVIGEEIGTGGWVQVKRKLGSTGTYTATIQVHAVGFDPI